MNKQSIRFFFLCTISIITYFIIKKFTLFIIPLFIAIIIALILHPFISFLDRRWRFGRTFNICIVILLFFITTFSVISFLFLALFHELEQFMDMTTWNIHMFLDHIYIIAIQYKDFLPYPFNESFLNIDMMMKKLIEEIDDNSMQFIGGIIDVMKNIVQSFTYLVTIIFFIGFTTFFLLKDYVSFIKFLKKIIPHTWMNYLYKMRRQFNYSMLHLIKAQFLLVCLTVMIIFIFLIVFSYDHIWTITWIIFIIDFIPYIGIGILFIPWIAYTFFTDQYIMTIQLSSLYILLIILRQIMEPKLYASSIGLHPLVVFFTLFMMLQQFGLFGVLFTPILLIIISVLYYTRTLQSIWHYIKYGTFTSF